MNDRYFMITRFCAKNAQEFDRKLHEYIKTLELENPGTEVYITEKNEQTEDENGLCYTITLMARDREQDNRSDARPSTTHDLNA